MLSIRQILVAKDFSPSSEMALREGFVLAGKTGATLHILYAQVLHGDAFDAPVYPQNHHDRVNEQLDQAVEDALDNLGKADLRSIPIVKSIARDVSAGAAIVRYAASHSIDVVIMGTHGRRGVRRMMMGSVAEEVVRTSECPVITIKGWSEEPAILPDGEREVLLPIDFSRHAEFAIPYAREIARLFKATVRVVHVIEETMHPAFYNAGAFSVYDLQPDIEQKALEFLKTTYAAAPGPEVPVTFEILMGHAAAEISRVAAERNVGMIVMATHGLTGMAHFFLGSVAERVVRAAPCPVFTLKSFSHQVPNEQVIKEQVGKEQATKQQRSDAGKAD